jgi:hypothetical protein
MGREELGRAWKKKEKASGLLDCTVKKGKKKKLGPLGWAARGKERGKRKRESGPGPIKKEGEKELHSNAFEFEFKI